MNDFYVYAWLRPCGTPFYIGKGRGRRAGQNKIHNQIFKRIVGKIKKAGEEPRVVKLHEGLRECAAFKLEKALIAKYGRRNNSTGILANLTDGGEGTSGRVVTQDTLAKMSAVQTGKKHTVETRLKMSLVRRGEKRSVETRAKMSARQRGRKLSPEHCANMSAANTGKKHTPETIAKMREASLNMSDESKRKISDHHKLAPPVSANNKSGFKGVSYIAERGKWCAMIKIEGKTRYLGRYLDKEEAARAYDRAAVEAWGVGNCYLNFHIAANDNAEIEPCKRVS